jgi:hypothetical protein
LRMCPYCGDNLWVIIFRPFVDSLWLCTRDFLHISHFFEKRKKKKRRKREWTLYITIVLSLSLSCYLPPFFLLCFPAPSPLEELILCSLWVKYYGLLCISLFMTGYWLLLLLLLWLFVKNWVWYVAFSL